MPIEPRSLHHDDTYRHDTEHAFPDPRLAPRWRGLRWIAAMVLILLVAFVFGFSFGT